ncbi:MAG: glycosyltransferase 87 family protein [Streptosporangiaceae bacterium]
MRSGGWDGWLAGRRGLQRLTAAYMGSAVICGLVAAAALRAFVDLHVYRLGAAAIVHGGWLYGIRFKGLPFTYPPFAAIALTPLAVVPWWLAAVLMFVANVAATPIMFYLALRLRPVASWLSRGDAVRLALAVAVVAIWLEPAYTTVAFGQVNILLTVMVLVDLTLPDDSPFKGVATGIAAGVKLIPLIFVLYLAATRRLRAAVIALCTFGATIALGYAVVPHASQYYYADLTFLHSSRVARLSSDWNQSLLGAVGRAIGSEPGSRWLAVVLVIGLAGIALAAAAGRRGDDATGYGLCAVTGLLVSPISWTHHWVMAVPALLLAGLAVWRRRHEAPARARFWLVVIALLAAIGWTGITRHQPKLTATEQLHLSVFWQVVSDIYVLAGLAALVIAAAAYLRRRRRHDRAPAAVAAVADQALAAAGQPAAEVSGQLRPRTSE